MVEDESVDIALKEAVLLLLIRVPLCRLLLIDRLKFVVANDRFSVSLVLRLTLTLLLLLRSAR
jgi:hypothetical protein